MAIRRWPRWPDLAALLTLAALLAALAVLSAADRRLALWFVVGAVVALAVAWGVAAARTGPDRVGEGLDPGVGQVVPSPRAGDSTPAGG